MQKRISFVLSLLILVCSLVSVPTASSGDTVKYYGDMDHNGSVTSADVRALLRLTVGNNSLSRQTKITADLSHDGTINSYDARLVLTCLINGQPEEMPEFPTDSILLPMSGFEDTADEDGVTAQLMTPEYTDTYTFTCSAATKLAVLREDNTEIAVGTKSVTVAVTDGERYVVGVKTAANQKVTVTATAQNHVIRLPYDITDPVDTTNISLQNNGTNPLEAATVDYKKRPGGMYIYPNNPELIPADSVGDAFIRTKDLTGEVYMTFEHANYSGSNIYLGYQLLNEGNEDVYVTVTNIGYQAGGTWFGQQAWYDFYNTAFELPSDYYTTSGQISSKYSGFDYAYEKYTPRVFQPVTYRLPAGEYFYVIGGTTADAYNNINVDNSANKALGNIKCANGNVKFSVTGGSVTGTFYAYNKASQVQANPQAKGYRTGAYAAQYLGTADHAGVIDNEMTWTFSDQTASGTLPVTYTNRYANNVSTTTPYASYDSSNHTTSNAKSWITHLNPQNDHRAVGTDIVDFACTDENGREVIIDSDHADGGGNPANTANWMIEYQDHFTLVNQGDRARTVTFNMKDYGTLAMLARDETGKVLKASYTAGLAESSCSYSYAVTIPAHSVKQLTLDYLLVACSYGNVTHSASLGG